MEAYLKIFADFIIYATIGIIAGSAATYCVFKIKKRFEPKRCPGCKTILVSDILSKKYGDYCPNENCTSGFKGKQEDNTYFGHDYSLGE